MKIGNLFALLIVAASMTSSMTAQTAQSATAKQKTAAAAETHPFVDLSNVPLQEGIHEIYRDAKIGVKVFSVVKSGKAAGFFAVDKTGEVLIPSSNAITCRSGHSICYGPPSHCVVICLPIRTE